jgi:ligand-binding sensor domain-containing protein
MIASLTRTSLLVLLIAAGNLSVNAQNFWQYVGSPGPWAIHTLYVDSGNVLFAGTSAGVHRSTNGGIAWHASGLTNEDVLTVKRHRGSLFAGTFAGGLYRSTNNGGTWIPVGGGFPPGGAFALAELGQLLFVANDNGIFKSSNGGTNWVATSLLEPNQQALTVSPAGHLYAGTVDAVVYRSTDAGVTWTEILDGNSTISDILVAPNGSIYVSLQSFFNPGVLRSTNNGVTWQNVLPSVVAGWFAINSAGHIFLSTYSSYVYRTVDGGSTWQQISTGMASAGTQGIVVNDSGVVFVGTLNGQVYRSAQPTVSVSDDRATPREFTLYQNYPNPFNPSTKIRFEVGGSGEGGSGFTVQGSRLVTLKVYDVLGREVEMLVNENLQPGSYEVTFDAAGLASGVYFYRLQSGEFTQTKRMVLMR